MVKRQDLVDIVDPDYEDRRREFILCQDCGTEFEGSRGDYFYLPLSYVFTCPDCGSEDLDLVQSLWRI